MAKKSQQTKKQLKKELVNRMESALPEIKSELGKKKFNKRIKKAANLLTEGVNVKDLNKRQNGKPAAENTNIDINETAGI